MAVLQIEILDSFWKAKLIAMFYYYKPQIQFEAHFDGPRHKPLFSCAFLGVAFFQADQRLVMKSES